MREKVSNGRQDDALHGQALQLPADPEAMPNAAALRRHNGMVFLA